MAPSHRIQTQKWVDPWHLWLAVIKHEEKRGYGRNNSGKITKWCFFDTLKEIFTRHLKACRSALPGDLDKHTLYSVFLQSWLLVLELSEVALHRGSHTELFMLPNRGAVYRLPATWGKGDEGCHHIASVCLNLNMKTNKSHSVTCSAVVAEEDVENK